MRLDAVLGSFLLVLFAALFIQTLGFRWEAAVAPMLATGAGVALSIWLLAGLRFTRRPTTQAWSYDIADARAFGGFLASVVCVGLLGFKVGAALYVFGYMLIVPRCSVKNAVLFGASVPIVVHFLIEGPLAIRLFAGFLLR